MMDSLPFFLSLRILPFDNEMRGAEVDDVMLGLVEFSDLMEVSR